MWPGVRRAGLPRRLSPALMPGRRRRRRRLDLLVQVNSAAERKASIYEGAPSWVSSVAAVQRDRLARVSHRTSLPDRASVFAGPLLPRCSPAGQPATRLASSGE
jgi:hypothetical protein